MKPQPLDVAAGVLVVVAVATAVSARRAAPEGSAVPSDAVAYHGAWQMYRTLAGYFGRRALMAETSYWKAVA